MGKTAFVTLFVHTLPHAADAPAADFRFCPCRGQVQGVSVEEIPGIRPFPYRVRLAELLAAPPSWPGRTTGLTGIRVRLLYTPTAGLTRMLFSTATVDLDLIDQPREWLLDLPMLTQSYREWSAWMEELANAGSRSVSAHSEATEGVRAAICDTPADMREALLDLKEDETRIRRAVEVSASRRDDRYQAALEALRDDTRRWRADRLACDPDHLQRFIEIQVMPWYGRRRTELKRRSLIREQAFGQSLKADKLKVLARYEVHLDRKLERMLTMLVRLKELRADSDVG